MQCKQSSYQTVFTLSKSYRQTLFWEFEWTLEQTENSQIENFQVKEKLAQHANMEQIILSSTVLEFTWLVIDGFMQENSPGYAVAKNINDIIATDHSFEECIFTVVETIQHLFQKLGFAIHPDKSKFVPAKIVEYLGWLRKMVAVQIFKKLKSEMVTRSEKKIHENCCVIFYDSETDDKTVF